MTGAVAGRRRGRRGGGRGCSACRPTTPPSSSRISFGVALAAYAAGRAALAPGRAARGRRGSSPWSSVVLGALVAARAMFVSSHDLAALVVVVIGAGTAGVLGGLALGAELARARRRVDGHGRARASPRAQPARAGGVGEPRPADAARRDPGHGRGARRRRRGRRADVRRYHQQLASRPTASPASSTTSSSCRASRPTRSPARSRRCRSASWCPTRWPRRPRWPRPRASGWAAAPTTPGRRPDRRGRARPPS